MKRNKFIKGEKLVRPRCLSDGCINTVYAGNTLCEDCLKIKHPMKNVHVPSPGVMVDHFNSAHFLAQNEDAIDRARDAMGWNISLPESPVRPSNNET